MDTYGPDYARIPGWIAEPGSCEYGHRFGGSAWTVTGTDKAGTLPSLLLTADATDSRCFQGMLSDVGDIPFVSIINSDAWSWVQKYGIDWKHKTVTLACSEAKQPSALSADLLFPDPLPEIALRLRPMHQTEIPSNEENYWTACDSFLGNGAFIRVGGLPLWLLDPVKVACECGRVKLFLACIGYESPSTTILIPNRPFFIGEGALYFFFCRHCGVMTVISQSS